MMHPGDWIQPFVWFPTRLGSRFLDACRYPSILHWAVDPQGNPTACYEFKSTLASRSAYLANRDNELAKDRIISGRYGFPILLVHAACWWVRGYLYCSRA